MSYRRGTRRDGSRFTHPIGHPSDNYKFEVSLGSDYMKWTMDIEKKLNKLEEVIKPYILNNPLIFVGCPEIGSLVYRVLEKLSIPADVYVGTVEMWNGSDIRHLWIEIFDYVIDPNPSQILNISLKESPIIMMPKAEWVEKTRPRDRQYTDIHDKNYFLAPTEIGEKFYNDMAEKIAKEINESVV